MLETALDLALLVLLVFVLAWSVLLNAKLRRLKGEDGELGRFVGSLDEATQRAEAAIDALREIATELQAGLARSQDSAKRRGDDLARVTESATRILRRLEQAIADAARSTAGLHPPPPAGRPERQPAEPEAAPDAKAATSRAEALLQALRGRA